MIYKLRPMLMIFSAIMNNYHLSANEELKAGAFLVSPWSFYDQKEKGRGPFHDLTLKLCELSQMKCSLNLYSLPRLVRELEKGRVDFGLLIRNTEDISPKIKEIGYVEKFQVVLASNQKIQNVNSLYGKKVVYLMGSNYNPSFMKIKEIDKFTVGHYRSGLEMVAKNRVTALLGPKLGIGYIYDQMESKYKKNAIQLFNLNKVKMSVFVSSKLSAEKIKKLQQSILEVKKKKLTREFLKKYSLEKYL